MTAERFDSSFWHSLAASASFAIIPVGGFIAAGPWAGLIGHLVVTTLILRLAAQTGNGAGPPTD